MPFTIPLTAKQHETLAMLNMSVETASAKSAAYVQALLDGAADVPDRFNGATLTVDGLVLGDAPSEPATPAPPAPDLPLSDAV
jgi:hypothetical protein